MTDRPIIYSGPMVLALLGQMKQETRRLSSSPLSKCRVRDQLWVRENARAVQSDQGKGVHFLADDALKLLVDSYEAERLWAKMHRYRSTAIVERRAAVVPSIHMPRWASRLTQTVIDVRFEPLQSISSEDAVCEGLTPHGGMWGVPHLDIWEVDPRDAYRRLWQALHPKEGERWQDNPEVLVLSFNTILRNIDG